MATGLGRDLQRGARVRGPLGRRPVAGSRGLFDEADRRRWVGEWGNWIRPETIVRYLEDGDILVIGIFNGVEPAAYPRHGILYVPPPE